MSGSINANLIVSVTPSVLSAGGSALDLTGVFLTQNSRVPMNQAMSFPNTLAVSTFFGPLAQETSLAAIYFNGFNGGSRTPGSIIFVQYPVAPVAAYLRGGNVSALTLAALQAVNGPLTITIDGVIKNVTITLTGAASFSAAATIIATALAPATCVYDSVSGAFVISSSTTGTTSSISYGSGTAATTLLLTQALGATISVGAIASTPAGAMTQVVNLTRNFATFTTCFEPVLSDKLAFANWNNGQGNLYMYVPWDTDITVTQQGNTTSFGPVINAAETSGTAPVYLDPAVSAFVMGYAASLDFTATNGRATAKFRSGTGITASVTSSVIATNLAANGYNYYGDFSTANDDFIFLANGEVSGPYEWIDSYLNQIWMRNQFQLALLVFLTQSLSVPYNDQGYTGIRAACLDVINQALNFGAIRAGVTLSQAQIVEVNNAVGFPVNKVLSTVGWYLKVSDAIPQVRAARTSPPISFYYMDGGSVQQLNLASVEVQ